MATSFLTDPPTHIYTDYISGTGNLASLILRLSSPQSRPFSPQWLWASCEDPLCLSDTRRCINRLYSWKKQEQVQCTCVIAHNLPTYPKPQRLTWPLKLIASTAYNDDDDPHSQTQAGAPSEVMFSLPGTLNKPFRNKMNVSMWLQLQCLGGTSISLACLITWTPDNLSRFMAIENVPEHSENGEEEPPRSKGD
ncbi:hypothetical protein P175DRAFT_0530298 [Aspergillus ochraceoroseus IBT 24754]|uniref:Uncharacterized protein n=1 Tax=Aspergillus ochraceoroseus IBT 24754 TaxID=1392256 RepID=A0A2T5M3S9_9EURO|nr:uncharacterized protein P175DRAFT_0530298 [Aspergillus ochraceoroseus IBT 24754]PTU23191.1 hypothetical protein P175DRAFT_0530298 [Aspergillus ochraceoroseus IBT 24754]